VDPSQEVYPGVWLRPLAAPRLDQLGRGPHLYIRLTTTVSADPPSPRRRPDLSGQRCAAVNDQADRGIGTASGTGAGGGIGCQITAV